MLFWRGWIESVPPGEMLVRVSPGVAAPCEGDLGVAFD